MNIEIAAELKDLCPGASLLVLQYEAEVQKSNAELAALVDKTIEELQNRYTMADLAELPAIKDTRAAYRKLGKAPTTYRNAAEAMLRRIVKGNGLYRINNVVEMNNVISISTGYSVGSYDTTCLSGDIQWRRAPDGERYQGIGKDMLNIEHLPTLYDAIGAFGNPTSDSRRAMITLGRHTIASVVYSFSGKDRLADIATQYQQWLQHFCKVEKVEIALISD